MNPLKEFKELKEDTKETLIELMEKKFKENKNVCYTPKNTSIRLITMTKTNQNFKIKFNKDIVALKSTQDEMKMEL